MRARNIKPSFFTNPDLGECSPVSRLLFAGLWCCADREGRLLDRPKQVKAQVFPYDNVDIEFHLGELAQYGLIERYESIGVKVIWIPAFLKHQRPHVKEKSSELPGKEAKPQPRYVQAPTQVSASTDLGTNEPALNPDTGYRIPECGMRNEEAPNPRPRTASREVVIPSKFDTPQFRDAWTLWRDKQRSTNFRDLDPATEQVQLMKLSDYECSDAIELILFCVGKTNCKNLIFDGSHKQQQRQAVSANGRSGWDD